MTRILRSSTLGDSFFRESPSGLLVLVPLHDGDGNVHGFEVLAANPALLRLTGRDAAEVVGHDLRELTGGGEAGERLQETCARALRRGAPAEAEKMLPFPTAGGDAPGWYDVSVLPLNGHLLVAIRSIDRRKTALMEAVRLMNVDDLTGIGNRRHLRNHFLRMRQRNRSAALVFLDLDGFKAVNDSHGHETGDEVLKIVAQRLNNDIRPGETAARLGGDEFAVLLDVPDPEAARKIAGRLRQSVARTVSVGDIAVLVTASLGIAMFPADADDFARLCAVADRRMYEDKARLAAAGSGERPGLAG